METRMRRAAILVLSVMILGLLRADPPAPDATLLARWPAKPGGEEQVFEGGQFLPLSPAPKMGTGPFTVSVWANANDLAGGNATYGRGIARSTRGEQVGDWLLSVHPDGRLRFCNWRKPGDDTTGSHVTRDPVIQSQNWYQIVCVWDGKANHLFVNGIEAPFTDGATATGWTTGHEVGRSWTQADYHWDGRIANLKVYSRVLSVEEIKQALEKEVPPPPRLEVFKPAGDPKVSAAIDREILAKLRDHDITPMPAALDLEFYRRAMLDLAGRIPIPTEVESFLADRTPDKRLRLIDNLLAGREMSNYWSQLLSGWLLPRETRRDPRFVGYLRQGLLKNKSWDTFAREMLIARPGGTTDQAASFFLSSRATGLKDGSVAREVGRAFFGVNLRCAQCHDHPNIPQWTQERFFGLAAFFARSYVVPTNPPQPNNMSLGEKPTGELEYTANGSKKVARLMFLDGKVVEEPPIDKDAKPAPPVPNAVPAFSRREALARVALDPKSPYFKRAIVNRVWRQLMGRALVEPVDMMYDGNPATHPQLLDLLADDFAQNGFDLRRLITVIMQSEAYGRSSRWTGDGKPPGETLYALANLRPLDADQMALALPVAAGYHDGLLSGQRTSGPARTALPWKEVVVEFDPQNDEFEATTSQALFLLNSNYVQTQVLAKSNLVQALSSMPDDAALARKAYLAILSRLPTPEDTALVRRHLSDHGPQARTEACRELVWALVTSAEFRFNH
jgi:hypothetical protein